jgi:hypothetical protein
MHTISRAVSAQRDAINWPAEINFSRPYSKEHGYHGERKPPSLSRSEKKNVGLRDVFGITTLILGSSLFFAFDVAFRLGGFSELVMSLPLAAALWLLVSIIPLALAFRLALGIAKFFYENYNATGRRIYRIRCWA